MPAPRVLAVIPARGGSKRLPDKNLLPLAGRPLIAYSIGAARAASTVTKVLVSTDDPDIAAIALALGAGVVERPVDMAVDTAPTLWAVQHAASGAEADLVVLLQPTCPLRPRGLVDRAVMALWTSKADGLLSVTPARVKIGDVRNGRFSPDYQEGIRKQDMAARFREDGVIYVTRRATLEAGSLFGEAPLAFDAGPIAPLANIDYEADMVVAEALYLRYKNEFEGPAL